MWSIPHFRFGCFIREETFTSAFTFWLFYMSINRLFLFWMFDTFCIVLSSFRLNEDVVCLCCVVCVRFCNLVIYFFLKSPDSAWAENFDRFIQAVTSPILSSTSASVPQEKGVLFLCFSWNETFIFLFVMFSPCRIWLHSILLYFITILYSLPLFCCVDILQILFFCFGCFLCVESRIWRCVVVDFVCILVVSFKVKGSPRLFSSKQHSYLTCFLDFVYFFANGLANVPGRPRPAGSKTGSQK